MVLPWGSSTLFFKLTNTRAFIKASVLFLFVDTLVNILHMAKLVIQIKRPFNLGSGEISGNVFVSEHKRLEVPFIGPNPHSVSLDPTVSFLAEDTLLRQIEQQLTGKNQTVH